jgi:hypothetical protein
MRRRGLLSMILFLARKAVSLFGEATTNRHRLRRILALIALTLLITGGGARHAHAATWSTTDLRSGAPLPSGTASVNHVMVTWQVGNYWSGGLRIYGLLCTPTSLPAPYPVAILNHGLSWVQTGPFQYYYPAIEANGWIGCTNMAGNGWLTAITTYRGEIIGATTNSGFPTPYTGFNATSDGGLELCLGEVDDVLNLLSAVTALPIASANQVLMWGHSHGSCVTERAIERGAPVQVAVSLDGPTDFTTWTGNNPILALTVAAQNARSSAWSGNDPGRAHQREVSSHPGGRRHDGHPRSGLRTRLKTHGKRELLSLFCNQPSGRLLGVAKRMLRLFDGMEERAAPS